MCNPNNIDFIKDMALLWKGTWDASLNIPLLDVASASNNGWEYMVSVAGEGTVNGFIQLFRVGDLVISNGSMWEVVAAPPSRDGLDQVDNTRDMDKPISKKQQEALDALSEKISSLYIEQP